MWWITIGVLVAGIFLFCFFGLAWIQWQRGKYSRDIQGKIKALFYSPGVITPTEKILKVEPDGITVKAPEGHTCGTYFIRRNAKWDTSYPTIPPFGIANVQVKIATYHYFVNQPEPQLNSDRKIIQTVNGVDTVEETNISVTPQEIFSYGDASFMFALRQAKLELEAERKELAKSIKGKLDPLIVYIGIGVAAIGSGFAGFMIYKWMPIIKAIADTLGVTY